MKPTTEMQEVPQPQPHAKQPIPTPGTIPTNRPLALGTRQDVFSLNEGNVSIQWPASLSPESYEDLAAWLDILKRKIGRSVAVNFGDLKMYKSESPESKE